MGGGGRGNQKQTFRASESASLARIPSRRLEDSDTHRDLGPQVGDHARRRGRAESGSLAYPLLQQQGAGALSEPAARAPQARPAPQRPCPASPPIPDAQPSASSRGPHSRSGGPSRPVRLPGRPRWTPKPGAEAQRRTRFRSGRARLGHCPQSERRAATRPTPAPAPGPALPRPRSPAPSGAAPAGGQAPGDRREGGRARQEGGPGRRRRRRAERGPQGQPSPRAASAGPRIKS